MDLSGTAFAGASISAFRTLVDEFKYDAPEIEQGGREVYVRYHKGARTVSIAYEPGSAPCVELFHPPTDPSEQPVPWATRNGVARCRRFPRLSLRTGISWGTSSPGEYLTECARALVAAERSWLASAE